VSPHLLSKLALLDLVAMFEEFLDNIVAKHIRHQLQGVSADLIEDNFFLISVRSLKFLLDKSRPMLITAKFHDVCKNVLIKF